MKKNTYLVQLKLKRTITYTIVFAENSHSTLEHCSKKKLPDAVVRTRKEGQIRQKQVRGLSPRGPFHHLPVYLNTEAKILSCELFSFHSFSKCYFYHPLQY